MEGKATILCENYVINQEGPIAEHGWAVFIETNRGNYLFDTGQGRAIINNAGYFHKDLSSIQGIILSHNHYDHTGGLLRVLELTGRVNVYSHPDLFKSSYDVNDKGIETYNGIPFCREVLENRGADFVFNNDFVEIAPGMILSGEIPHVTDFEEGDNNLFVKTKEGYARDFFLDDQTLFIRKKKGLVIILGCSHAGVVNIIKYAIKKTGQSHIHTVIGGTHLGRANEETRERSIEALKKFDIERIGVSHCTGLETSLRLFQEFGERFFFCNVGTVVEI